MVNEETKKRHMRPQVTSRGAYWDGPISNMVTFQDKEGILWRTDPILSPFSIFSEVIDICPRRYTCDGFCLRVKVLKENLRQ